MATNSMWPLSRTQVRRAQRHHTLACLKAGILIAKERREVHEQLIRVLDQEAAPVLQSLAIHRSDCKHIGANIHYASHANALAHQHGHKSGVVYKEHKRVHQAANLVKHEHSDYLLLDTTHPPLDPPPHLPPPAPPALPGLHSAIACADLEAFRFSLFGQVTGLGEHNDSYLVESLYDTRGLDTRRVFIELDQLVPPSSQVQDVLQYLCNPGGDHDKVDNDTSRANNVTDINDSAAACVEGFDKHNSKGSIDPDLNDSADCVEGVDKHNSTGSIDPELNDSAADCVEGYGKHICKGSIDPDLDDSAAECVDGNDKHNSKGSTAGTDPDLNDSAAVCVVGEPVVSSELSFTEFLSAAVSQTSMKRYKFVRNCNFDSSFAMSNKCASMSCPVDLLQEHWPDAPPRVREQYRVLLKVGSVNRTKVENMRNQIRLPIRPFQADCISQLAIRLLRATEGLGLVSADFPLYGLAPPAHVSGDSDCKQQ